MPSPYVELHARSAFSFLEGASVPEDLASRAAEFGQPALAITDTHGVYGAPRFHLAAQKLGIRALIGAEINSSGNRRYTLLCESRRGYQNLCRLITRTKFRDRKPGKHPGSFASREEMKAHLPDLIPLVRSWNGWLACSGQGMSSSNCSGITTVGKKSEIKR
jgi:error-prone DNA polymerase